MWKGIVINLKYLKSMKKIFFLILFLVISLSFVTVEAQGLNTAGSLFRTVGNSAGADTYNNPEDLVGVIINAALTLTGLIFLVLMIYAGYLWLTARGEDEPIGKAKKIITSSVIGFVLVASAYSITVFIGGRLETETNEVADTSCESGFYSDWSCISIDTCFINNNNNNNTSQDLAEKRNICKNNPTYCAINKCANQDNSVICCKITTTSTTL